MPVLLVPLHEFNHCHDPASGQFCGPGTWAAGRGRTQSRRATTSGMHPATDKERRKLAVPPAYTHAMVADDPKAELRATAVSPATGKTAYFYSAAYKRRQADAKWARIVAVQTGIEDLERRMFKDLARPGRDDYHPAMTLRLILQTGMRNGTEPDGETFGASSLLMEHVSVTGNRVRFQFPGKGGKNHDLTVTDSLLAEYATNRRAMGARTLFPHEGADTLAYLKRIKGDKFKVHDLRTWYATVYADHLVATALKDGVVPTTKQSQKQFRNLIAETVAGRLGNTKGMALSTYIHPRVWDAIGWKP